MDQFIEFPIVSEGMFTEPLDLRSGYCLCYQHDTDIYGYGPYGFDTDTANRVLTQALPPLLYWNATQQKLIEAISLSGSGIYFYKNQQYLQILEKELLEYDRAEKSYALRARYNRLRDPFGRPAIPEILKITSKNVLPASFIKKLLADHTSFLIVYSLMPYNGQTLALFDSTIRERIKTLVSSEDIHYRVLESIDELKPW